MRYQIKQAKPTWKESGVEGAFIHYEDYMKNEHGYSVMFLKGGVGNGEKVHRFRVLGKIEGNNIHVADIMCLCGSQKFNSRRLYLHDEQDNIECTCKKCGGK